MSTIVPSGKAGVKPMRWTARIISIPWAYWAIFWTLFLTAHMCPNNPSMWAILIPVLIAAFLLFLGAAIVASVWGKEALGGRLLIADGMLLFILGNVFMLIAGGWKEVFTIHPIDIVGLLTIVLPPLVAGALFLKCHRQSSPVV